MNQTELEQAVVNYKTQVKQILSEMQTWCATFDEIDRMDIDDESKTLRFQEILDRMEALDKQWKKAEQRWTDSSRDLFQLKAKNAHKVSREYTPFNQVMGVA